MKTIIITLLTFVMFNAAAISLEIPADKDNTLYETATGDLSNGAGDYFFAGRNNQAAGISIRRGLLHFDLTSIPAGAIINDVSLEITNSQGNLPTNITLHALTSDWGEAGSNAMGGEGSGIMAESGDATWTQNFYEESSSWLTNGGDFDSNVLATAQVTAGGPILISGPALTTQIQQWYDTPASNFGLLIQGDESTLGTAVRFNSRENLTGPPKLVVDYDIPIELQAQLNPVKDNTLYETDTGSTSNGAGTRLFIGKTGSNAGLKKRRAVLEFDLSSIPPIATIHSVDLSVMTTNTPPAANQFDASLHLLLSEWGEGTSNSSGNGAPATSNDATWLHNFFDTSNWNTPGGDYSSTVSATAAVGTTNGEVINFASTVDLVADVQLWIENENVNHGWIILGDELTDRNARGLSSREGTSPPVLTVSYSIPDLIFEDGFE
ncbi:MAG: DNRLRE domain-containing protein [Marinicella sp.]|nr:DNRLRE domain-containing protein [Xanthomonadales bacterium]